MTARTFLITGTSRNEDGELVVDYKDSKGKDLFSPVHEIRQWIKQTKLTQAAASITPKCNGYQRPSGRNVSADNKLRHKTPERNQDKTHKLPKGRQLDANSMVPS